MKVPSRHFEGFRVLSCGIVATAVLVSTVQARNGAAEVNPAPAKRAAVVEKTGARDPTVAGSTNSGHGLVVDGERFTVRQIIDTQQGGLAVCAFSVPETWRDTSKVLWNYQNTSSPVQLGAGAE